MALVEDLLLHDLAQILKRVLVKIEEVLHFAFQMHPQEEGLLTRAVVDRDRHDVLQLNSLLAFLLLDPDVLELVEMVVLLFVLVGALIFFLEVDWRQVLNSPRLLDLSLLRHSCLVIVIDRLESWVRHLEGSFILRGFQGLPRLKQISLRF